MWCEGWSGKQLSGAARASRPQTCRSGGHELTAPSQAAKLPDKFCADLLACPGPANRLTPGMLHGMTPIRASSGLTTPAVAIPSGPIAAGISQVPRRQTSLIAACAGIAHAGPWCINIQAGQPNVDLAEGLPGPPTSRGSL